MKLFLNLNSSPTPFSLCLSPYLRRGRLRLSSFWHPCSWMKLLGGGDTFWEDSLYRDSSCQVVVGFVLCFFFFPLSLCINLLMAAEWSISLALFMVKSVQTSFYRHLHYEAKSNIYLKIKGAEDHVVRIVFRRQILSMYRKCIFK